MPELYIDGEWAHPACDKLREVICPANGSLVASVSEAGAEDTVRAISAARTAFDVGPWPRTPERERGATMGRVADIIERDKVEFARAESLDTGKRIAEAEDDVDFAISGFRYIAGIAGTNSGHVVDSGCNDAISRVVHEPVGVCGLITPWNYPLQTAAWKVAPALAAGNTIVLKPSELTPSTSIMLMRALAEAGVPGGAANLVLGAGDQAGAPLAAHPDVDMVSFTGSLVTGRRIMATAAETVKNVALELGGKNPNIVFADADLEAAIDLAVTAIFLHSGQVCSAGSRLVVQDNVHDVVVDEIVRRAQNIRLGGPFDDSADTGSLISAAHLEKVSKYVQVGTLEGAVLRCGGERSIEGHLAKGFFFLPTVLDECHSSMRVVQDESFGPVLTVERFTDEDDAIRIANDTVYGLAAGVWTEDAGKAQRMAQRLRAGTVWINDYGPFIPQAEWGGFKQSGLGRELGRHALADFQETKHIWQNIRPKPQHWFPESNS